MVDDVIAKLMMGIKSIYIYGLVIAGVSIILIGSTPIHKDIVTHNSPDMPITQRVQNQQDNNRRAM